MLKGWVGLSFPAPPHLLPPLFPHAGSPWLPPSVSVWRSPSTASSGTCVSPRLQFFSPTTSLTLTASRMQKLNNQRMYLVYMMILYAITRTNHPLFHLPSSSIIWTTAWSMVRTIFMPYVVHVCILYSHMHSILLYSIQCEQGISSRRCPWERYHRAEGCSPQSRVCLQTTPSCSCPKGPEPRPYSYLLTPQCSLRFLSLFIHIHGCDVDVSKERNACWICLFLCLFV